MERSNIVSIGTIYEEIDCTEIQASKNGQNRLKELTNVVLPPTKSFLPWIRKYWLQCMNFVLFVILIISVIRISKSSTSKMQDLSREQKKMANQIQTVLEVMNTSQYPKVVFSAFGSTGKTLKNTTILFDKLIVDINVGDTFNLSMGTFTVPVKGAYEFTFYTGYALGKTEVDVLKNGRKSFKFTNQESNFHLPINSLWHMVLEKGDLVKLFVSLGHIDVASSDGDKAIRIFSGKLLK